MKPNMLYLARRLAAGSLSLDDLNKLVLKGELTLAQRDLITVWVARKKATEGRAGRKQSANNVIQFPP